VKQKHQRMIFIIVGLALMLAAAFFILNNFRDNLVFFYTPTELYQKKVPATKLIRIGGLVADGSVVKNSDITDFSLTDMNEAVKVTYKGILPALFREGQGVVAHGHMGGDGVFIADNLLAKHDERYMPPEVAEALKKSGKWRPEKFK
jgi:cytochrome c-type biogenesis protein CcmE